MTQQGRMVVNMKYLILLAFIVAMIVVGIITSKKVTTATDFIVGGRRMGAWLSSFSYGTTYFSAVIFVGYAGRFGWSFGISAIWIGIGNAVLGSLLAWLVLAERTRKMSLELNATTMADLIGRRYKSSGLEIFAAIIIFVFLIPYSASVYQGLGYILQRFFAGTFMADLRVSMFMIAVVTSFYIFFGGYVSTAVNSLIQGIIMLVGVVFMVERVIAASGGLPAAMSALAVQKTAGAAGALASPFGPNPLDLLVLVLMTSIGTFGLPQMIAKYKGIRDKKAVKRATLMSTAFALVIGGGAYLMGAFSQVINSRLSLNLDPKNLDQVMPVIFETILSPEMMALLVVLMLSASMSTLAGVVLVSAPTFSRSILKNNSISLMRIMSIVFVIASYLIAIIPSAIVTLMAFSWGAVSGSFIGPYIWGLYSSRMTRAGATAGMVGGLGTVLVGAAIALSLNAATATSWAPRLAVIAMGVSLIATPIVSYLTRGAVAHEMLPAPVALDTAK